MSDAATGVALEVDGVGFEFPGRRVLEDISFSVPAGAFCVLLGVNGAGKTTLFSLITRLFLCRTGRIRIFGRDVGRDGRRALAQLGVVFQQPTLDLDLTVRQNLNYYCALQGLTGADLRARIDGALSEAGLLERAGDRARQLSGGQRRRLELLRAMLHRPRLLLADEPTVGLDIHSRQDIIARVRERCREDGVGVLWATHLVDEVQPEDRMLVIHRGRLLAADGVAEILAETGRGNVHDAFTALTGGPDA